MREQAMPRRAFSTEVSITCRVDWPSRRPIPSIPGRRPARRAPARGARGGDHDPVTLPRPRDRQFCGTLPPDEDHARGSRLLNVGPGEVTGDGRNLPLAVKAGHRILFGKYSGIEVTLDGEEQGRNVVNMTGVITTAAQGGYRPCSRRINAWARMRPVPSPAAPAP